MYGNGNGNLTETEALSLAWVGLESVFSSLAIPANLQIPSNHTTIYESYREKTPTGKGIGCNN